MRGFCGNEMLGRGLDSLWEGGESADDLRHGRLISLPPWGGEGSREEGLRQKMKTKLSFALLPMGERRAGDEGLLLNGRDTHPHPSPLPMGERKNPFSVAFFLRCRLSLTQPPERERGDEKQYLMRQVYCCPRKALRLGAEL